ncbi:elongation of very long chain fatty acids protein 7-like isoform X2 [Aricia agestis]|nr:elongation of very long chain fatty acids protein 7-like isoform X2 [Aricia agestis]
MVDSWFMMSSPKPILTVVVLYLVFLRVGPRLMKNRQPLRITKLISYYNAAQVVLASMICFKATKLNLFRDGIMYAGCRYPSNTQNALLLDIGWWYFFAKFTELLDTVFFVLRKKNKQITFLHVYHHVIMALYSWSYLKFAAGGEGTILALLNSLVHVVMYSYYLLSGLGPKYQKYLWWKKYVTKMQLLQFLLMLAYCAWTYNSPRCQFAVGFTYFISANVTIFLILFLNFYSKSYKKSKEFKSENGFTVCKPVKDEKEDGFNTFGVDKICGDYVKDGQVYLSRRTAKALDLDCYEK